MDIHELKERIVGLAHKATDWLRLSNHSSAQAELDRARGLAELEAKRYRLLHTQEGEVTRPVSNALAPTGDRFVDALASAPRHLHVAQAASEIAQSNPAIDPEVLAEATRRTAKPEDEVEKGPSLH